MDKRFANLFQGLKRAHGVFEITGKDETKNKITGRAKTVAQEPKLANFKLHLAGDRGIGIVPINEDNQCYFGAIDIDIYEGLGIEKLHATIRDFNLPLIPCTTKSGGIHLYVFFSEPISAKIVYDKLSEWSILLGYPGVEIFPKQIMLASENDTGNWLNMPYFDGNKTNRYALSTKNTRLSLEEFLDLAEEKRLTLEDLNNIKIPQNKEFEGAPPCLKVLISRGIPSGSRNKGLFALGTFYKLKYADNFADYVDKANQKYFQPPLPSQEVTDIVRSLRKKDYFFSCKDSLLADICNKRICVQEKYGITQDNAALDVAIDSLTKVSTDPPSWYISVNGKRLECDTTKDLLSQAAFQIKCVDSLHIFPRNIRAPVWRQMMCDLLTNVETIDAPEDANEGGMIDDFMSSFIEERHMKNSNRESDLLLGRPYIKDGKVYFRSSDVIKYLKRQGFYYVNNRTLYKWFRNSELEVEAFRIRIKGKQVRCWSTKLPEVQEEGFEEDELF